MSPVGGESKLVRKQASHLLYIYIVPTPAVLLSSSMVDSELTSYSVDIEISKGLLCKKNDVCCETKWGWAKNQFPGSFDRSAKEH